MKNEILDTLREVAVDLSRGLDDDLFQLRGLWALNYLYRPGSAERELNYGMVIAQTMGQGCSYAEFESVFINRSLLGQDSRHATVDDISTQIAVLDSAYSVFKIKPSNRIVFDGWSETKAYARANIVADEVERLLGGNRGRILNVGVMGIFIDVLKERGFTIQGTDFDSRIIGEVYGHAPVRLGTSTLELIAEHDLVLATGMTLATNTLADIIRETKRHGRKLILFAATGSHFGLEYCRTFGVDVVVSEPQPQYMFQGQSTIKIFRRDDLGSMRQDLCATTAAENCHAYSV
jgi:Putative heavy-metal chelation